MELLLRVSPELRLRHTRQVHMFEDELRCIHVLPVEVNV